MKTGHLYDRGGGERRGEDAHVCAFLIEELGGEGGMKMKKSMQLNVLLSLCLQICTSVNTKNSNFLYPHKSNVYQVYTQWISLNKLQVKPVYGDNL